VGRVQRWNSFLSEPPVVGVPGGVSDGQPGLLLAMLFDIRKSANTTAQQHTPEASAAAAEYGSSRLHGGCEEALTATVLSQLLHRYNAASRMHHSPHTTRMPMALP
jgi:hypothetical protein